MPRKAFSGKQKKAQMKEKRAEKFSKVAAESKIEDEDGPLSEVKPLARDLEDLHMKQNKSGTRRLRKTRYVEEQHMMDKKQMERWRLDAIQRPLVISSTLEWPFLEQTRLLGIPIRPCWTGLSAQKLHQLEEDNVKSWSDSIEKSQNENDVSINDFEQRVGPWRCLWQLLDSCQFLIVVLDSRLPNFFFPHGLVDHALNRGISVIIALNKSELNPGAADWIKHFASEPSQKGAIVATVLVSARSQKSTSAFALQLEQITQEYLSQQNPPSEVAIDSPIRQRSVKMGVVGHPNVGKSSLINGLMKWWDKNRAAAANPTPGRTHHNQTFEVLEKDLILEDCPGITFPVLGLNLPLSILMGSYSISQIREPLSVLRFLLEHSGGAENMLESLKLMSGLKGGKRALLDLYGEVDESMIGPWTPYLVAECVAVRKNMCGRGGRPDVHAACLFMIKRSFLGELPSLSLQPPVRIKSRQSPLATAAEGEEEHVEEGPISVTVYPISNCYCYGGDTE